MVVNVVDHGGGGSVATDVWLGQGRRKRSPHSPRRQNKTILAKCQDGSLPIEI